MLAATQGNEAMDQLVVPNDDPVLMTVTVIFSVLLHHKGTCSVTYSPKLDEM